MLARAWIGAILVVMMGPRAWTYCGSLWLGGTGNSIIQKLFQPRQMGKASHPKNRTLKVGHWPRLEVAALPGWAGQRPPWVECHIKTGVGAVSPETALPYCLHYMEKRAPMPHAKMPPLSPGHSGQGHGPQTTVCEKPATFNRWWFPGSGWRCLLWMVPSGAEHPPMPMPRPANGQPPQWAWPKAG